MHGFSKSFATSTLHHFVKRSLPLMDKSLRTNAEQINNAFRDAISLARSTILRDLDDHGTVFVKYFDNIDTATVRDVFLSITGRHGDSRYPGKTGNTLLQNIRITQRDLFGHCASDPSIMALLINYDQQYPMLQVCPKAGLGHGKIYRGPNPVKCEDLGDIVSWRMETLGSIFLHEYTYAILAQALRIQLEY